MNIFSTVVRYKESSVVAWLLGEERSPAQARRVEYWLCHQPRLRSFALQTVQDLADVAEALGDPHALITDRVEWLHQLQQQSTPAIHEVNRQGSPWWFWLAAAGSGMAALLLLAGVFSYPLTVGTTAYRSEEREAIAPLLPLDAPHPVSGVVHRQSASVARESELGEMIGELVGKKSKDQRIAGQEKSEWVDWQVLAEPAAEQQKAGGLGGARKDGEDSRRRAAASAVDYDSPTGFVVNEGIVMRKQQQERASSRPESEVRATSRAELLDAISSSWARGEAEPIGRRRVLDRDVPIQVNRLEARANRALSDSGAPLREGYVASAPRPTAAPAPQMPRSGEEYRREGAAKMESAEQRVGMNRPAESPSPLQQHLKEESSGVEMLDVRLNPFSTFSLNVSDASYRLAQSALAAGQVPEPHTVRPEEFYNHFDYQDPVAQGQPVAFFAEVAEVPFLHNQQIVRFSVKTESSGRAEQLPLNLTLVVDHSGSMTRLDRQQVMREITTQLAALLQKEDRWALVTFAEHPTVQQVRADAAQMRNLTEDLQRISTQGGTNIQQALQTGYETARSMYSENAINRVVLITDGAANMGDDRPDELAAIVELNRKKGIYFDAIGVGWEDYNDTMLERLARNGEGKYRFVNDTEDVESLIQALAGSFHPAARDVKTQVEWNPNQVSRYRLIGYETHRLRDEDFRNDAVDAAEMARNEVGNALYLVETISGGSGPLGTVRVRYKPANEERAKELAWVLPAGSTATLDSASPSLQLASVAAFFAETLIDPHRYSELTLEQMEQWLRKPGQVYPKQVPALQRMISQARGMIR